MSGRDQFLFAPSNGGSLFGHLGGAESMAHDARAPLDQVADASEQVFKKYHDPSLVNPDLISVMKDWVQLTAAQKAAETLTSRPMEKALKMQDVRVPDAHANTQPIINRLGAGGNYIMKPGLPFLALRELGKRVEVAQAIHRTRRRQVQAFSAQSQKDDIVGWRLRAADPNAQLGEEHEAFLSWLSQWLTNGGVEFNARARRKAGQVPFRRFLSTLTEHSLSFDHAAVELTPIRGGGSGQFWVRDSATFYLATEFDKPDKDDIFIVQDTMPGGTQEFTYDQAVLFQRNQDADVMRCGYGYSELESGIETISNFLQAMSYTREGLDNNAIPKGILMMSGMFSPEQKNAFHSAWASKLRGAQNAYALPVLFSHSQGKAEYLQTNQPFSEMAFAKWISLQSAILCALYGIDPAEIGMEPYYSGSSSGLSGDDTGERLAAARDKGLDPFLADIESFVSDELVGAWAPWVRFSFSGVRPGDEKQKSLDRNRCRTIDELRKALGDGPYPIAWIGALPADPALMQAELSRQQLVLTVNEGRKVFGGLPEFPDPILGNAPLNASLASAWNMVLTSRDAYNNGGADDPDNPDAPGEDGDGQDAHGDDAAAGDEADAHAEGRDEAGSGDDSGSGLASRVGSGLSSLSGARK